MEFDLPDDLDAGVTVLAPRETEPAPSALEAVEAALDAAPVWGMDTPGAAPLGDADTSKGYRAGKRAVIAVSDKTRPVPHADLLPPLLSRLEALGFLPQNITLLIAAGTHTPMPPSEFAAILPPEILARYPVYSHDCDAADELVQLGVTTRGTPVAVNRRWWEADLRVVAGNIEPHQFMGFTGGVKSAAVGLTARVTINTNHAMMTAPGSQINHYEDNPCRQDVEEIGRMIGVSYALNAILNDRKQIVHVLAGPPADVMQAGIPLLRAIYEVKVNEPFDLMIIAPGGYPKDINLYQAQKALGHAILVARPGGAVILAAACPEGTGSAAYENWMLSGGFKTHEQVLARYKAEGYRIGPHKAWQIARDATRVRLMFVSDIRRDLAKQLLLNPFESVEDALAAELPWLRPTARIAVMPFANATIPVLG